jgi:hypothetical protein
VSGYDRDLNAIFGRREATVLVLANLLTASNRQETSYKLELALFKRDVLGECSGRNPSTIRARIILDASAYCGS